MDQGEDDIDPTGPARKQDPLDFALWKAHKPGEDTFWPSPWGDGRPGWHIECSAMAEQYLGVGFDIHGGGSDLVFPHHENEAAQTRCGRGAELARIWMHNGMLQLSGEKMAKSVGNIELLADALDRWGRDTLVMFFVSGHYRQPLQYSEDALTQAQRTVERIREAGRKAAAGGERFDAFEEQFFAALADDFNTPGALAALFNWVRRSNQGDGGDREQLRTMLGVLGLDNLLDEGGREPSDEERELLERRRQARADRDFAEADRLRDELAARGWQVRDTPQGGELVPVGQ
jgi:cysteinyl-tRNA synthetase